MKAKKIILLLLTSILLSACGSEDEKQVQGETLETIIISEVAQINKIENLENNVEENESIYSTYQEEKNDNIVQMYSNASISFEYPVEWELVEQQGEDGCRVRITNPNEQECAEFELVQGEAWRVNLEYTKEDYAQFLSEKYTALEINDLQEMTIDGYNAKKLQFSYKENEQKYIGTKYMIVADLVSFDMTYVYPLEKGKEYEKQGEKMIESICLKYASEHEDLSQQEYYQTFNQAFESVNDFTDIPIIGLSDATDTELKIKNIIEEFSKAYFTGDVQGQKKYICESATDDINTNNYTENGVIVIGIKGLTEVDNLMENQEKNIQLEICFSGEESLTYLSMQFIKENEEWKIKAFGLEK